MFGLGKDPRESLTANFLPQDQEKKANRQTLFLAVVFTISVAAAAAIGAGASYRAVHLGTNVFSEVGNLPIISDMRRVMFGGDPANAAPVADDRFLNFLFLGVGGDGHDGPQLTDTIIFASVDLKEKKLGFVSLPRDLAYPLGGGRFEKINAVNAYAEQDHPGEGASRTKDALATLLETRIDHVVRIDFKGFSEFIDAINGVDINVERGFSDAQYPTTDEKWTTISFKKGVQHMDGATALTFTRSRHGTNGEGSDFARSARQQLVIMAVREKLLSLNTLGDPKKLAALYAAISQNVQSDLSVWDMVKLASLAKDLSHDRMTSNVLTDAEGGELVAANVNGAFMLFPRKPDWSEIRDIVKDPFISKQEQIAKDQPKDHVKVEIKNGTQRTGFASQAAVKLEKMGYEITAFGNANRRGYDRSVIFDLTSGKKPAELNRLKKLLGADFSMTTPTGSASSTMRIVYGNGLSPERIFSPNSDFLVILGETSVGLVEELTSTPTASAQ